MAGEWGSSSRAELIMEPAPAPVLEPVTARKPRGRPLGSKNRPKPPEAAMQATVLELTAGCDVVSALAAFSRRRHVGVSVLSASGTVAAVTLRQPAAEASAVTLHGRFEVLALLGTLLPSPGPAAGSAPAFSVFLAGAGGHVIAGTLAGEMTVADGVVVVAAMFSCAEVHRLPPTPGAEDADARGGGREGRHQHWQQQLQVAGLGGLAQPAPIPGLPVHPVHRF